MNYRKTVLISIIVLALAALSFMIFPLNRGSANNSPINSIDAPYSKPGSFTVGVIESVIEADPPLDLTIWYPAQKAEKSEKDFEYQYKIKLGDPLGAVTIAHYRGQSVPGASPEKASGPYPTVILSPGFSISSTAYAWLAEHLASYGFVVISPDHNENLDPENQLWQRAITRPQDIQAVLSFTEEELLEQEPLQGLINIDSVAVIGHSYGGYTALAAAGAQINTESFQTTCLEVQGTDQPGAWLCEMLLPHIREMADLAGLDTVPDGFWPNWGDERVKAIVPIAGDAFFFGKPGLAQISVPVLAIGGTADVDSPYLWATHPSFEYSSGPRKAEVALIDAEHMIFTGQCEQIRWYLNFFSGEFCDDNDWNRDYAHQITKHFTTAFLLTELKNDQAAETFLLQSEDIYSGVSFESIGY